MYSSLCPTMWVPSWIKKRIKTCYLKRGYRAKSFSCVIVEWIEDKNPRIVNIVTHFNPSLFLLIFRAEDDCGIGLTRVPVVRPTPSSTSSSTAGPVGALIFWSQLTLLIENLNFFQCGFKIKEPCVVKLSIHPEITWKVQSLDKRTLNGSKCWKHSLSDWVCQSLCCI